MVSDCFIRLKTGRIPVLILVLMEYGLWLNGVTVSYGIAPVLILVLMEYGLWLTLSERLIHFDHDVLILVLMEYGLWPIKNKVLPF